MCLTTSSGALVESSLAFFFGPLNVVSKLSKVCKSNSAELGSRIVAPISCAVELSLKPMLYKSLSNLDFNLSLSN